MNDRVYVMRQAIVKLTQMLAGRGITVTQEGISAYVRPDSSGRPVRVNLPYLPDGATEELITAIQGFLDHEVAHILFTDFKATHPDPSVHNMCNLLEDTRIEREMAKRFEGSAYNLGETAKFFLDKYTKPKMEEAIARGDNDMLVAVLTVPLVRAMADQQVFKEFIKDHMGQVQPVYDKIKDLEPKIKALGSTGDALKMALEIMTRLRGKAPESGDSGKGKASSAKSAGGGGKGASKGKAAPPPEKDEEEADDSAGSGKGGEKDKDEEGEEEDKDEGSGSDAGDGADDESGEDDSGDMKAAAGGDTGDEIEVEDDSLVPPDAPDEAAPAPTGAERVMGDGLSAVQVAAIDKETANDYDSTVSDKITDSAVDAAKASDYLVYSTDKDVIEPLPVGREYRDSMLTDMLEATEHMVAPMQKDLERAISARSLSVWSSGLRSGKLHAANLSRLAIQTPAGHDDRVFRKRHDAASKDVAVMLVVDASGSMAGSKIHTATQAAFLLAATLERIGIRCEVIAFTTGDQIASRSMMETETARVGRRFSRYETLYMPILKSFEERLTTDVRKRFGWLPNSRIMSQNVDGESVEIAGRRLMRRRETGKVMIVLSDGFPAASGGGADLYAHLKRVVSDLQKTGMTVVGIGIESDAVQQFYPKYMVLKRVAELPGAVMKELRSLIVK